jgi:type VI secretion system protein ImpK
VEDNKQIIRPQPGQRDVAMTEALLAPVPQSPILSLRPCPVAPSDAGSCGDTGADPLTTELRRAGVALVLNEGRTFASTLVEAAADLLTLALQVRHVDTAVDVPQLNRQAALAVQRFVERATAATVKAETVQRASYLLCSLVDEAVLNTEWGEQSLWSQRSLLRLFHQETWGGERVFRYIDAALNDARHQQDLLELAFHILALGFEGKYRVDPRGSLHLEQLRDDIYRVLSAARERGAAAFPPPVEPAFGLKRRLQTFSSLWVLGALLFLLVFGLYYLWLLQLNERSDGLRSALAALMLEPIAASVPVAMRQPEADLLRTLLAPEIERAVLRVEEGGGRVSVVLQTETMFDAGSATIAPAFLPILDKIGKALEAIPGRVVVSGHTDSDDIRTARYPSNWHLSLARASEVVKYMAGVASLRGRMLPEGRGDTEPVADNATADGRARNRRVVIEVELARLDAEKPERPAATVDSGVRG